MAEEKTTTQPSSTPPATEDARFFSMPEPYRHGKETKVVEPLKEQKRTPPSAPTPLPPPPSRPLPLPKGEGTHRALWIAAALVLLSLVIGGYLVWRSVQKQTPAPAPSVPTTPVPRPAPEPEPTPEPETTPAPVSPPAPAAIQPGKDSDSDGLTDLEEDLIYRTNQNLPDTDSDGFLDGNEVFHRYNPNGIAPGTLLGAGLVKVLDTGTIAVAYPSVWQTAPLEELSHVFTATTGETITIRNAVDPAAWIAAQGGQENVVKTKTKTGFDLYLTQNKRQAYILMGSAGYDFTYVLGAKQSLDYLQTFQMMLNSVEAVSVPGV